MRRFAIALALLLVLAIALPPLYFHVFPVAPTPLPVPGRLVDVRDGVRVNTIIKGEGPVIVLVHGLPGTAYDWELESEALATRGFRTYAYDRVGYGHSDPRPDENFSVAANALELLGLLEREDLRDATVVGHSYGGPIAIEAAGRDASRIARLVLVGSGGPMEDDAKPPHTFALVSSEPVLEWLAAVPPAGNAVLRSISARAFSGAPEPIWWIPLVTANFERPTTRHSYGRENTRVAEGDMSIDPLTVSVPILLIHGEDDRLVPVAVSHWIESHARRAKLVVVEDGSHMLPITHADLLADQIAGFIQGS